VGDTGKVIKPGSPEDLSVAWLEMLEMRDDELALQGARARRRVETMFEIGAVVRRYEELYSGIVEMHRKRQHVVGNA
jgi:hypothetical protein